MHCWRDGPQATSHSYADQQHNSCWCCEQQHSTKTHQSHGRKIPLAPMPGSPRPIPILLASRTYQQSQLLDQAPVCSTPHQEVTWNPHAQNCTRVTSWFLEMHTSPSSSSRCINIHTTHYVEVLKGCVRYPLPSYKGNTPLARDASRSACVWKRMRLQMHCLFLHSTTLHSTPYGIPT